MKVSQLVPCPPTREKFELSTHRFVSNNSGCYVLATFQEDILYVGLAKKLRRRFSQHLDDPRKVGMTANGRAFWFFWIECDDLEVVERSWMNAHIIEHGTLPVLNEVFSPTNI